MSKRRVAYVKPAEPEFLKRLKKEAGYVEGPTINTKHEHENIIEDEERQHDGEEEPTIVVLNEGDLSAEEVVREQKRLEREAAETPADLSKPIIFKPPNKQKNKDTTANSNKDKSSNKIKKISKTLLSFDEEENDD